MAQSIYGERDSIYFMQDDGEFSEEEKDAEAMYIYQRCMTNAFQKVYFNCECIAGAFRQEREKVGAYVPQSKIYNELFGVDQRACVSPENIAGDNYESCMRFANIGRPREKNNEEYCGCVANKVARDFGNKPYLRTAYIENLRVDAMSYCDQAPILRR